MALAWMFKKLLFGNAFAIERGRIRLFGHMDWILIPARALARDLQMIGEKQGKEFLYRLGYEGGKEGAAELLTRMQLKPKGGWVTQKAVLALLEFLGYGRPELVRAKVAKNGRHHVLLRVWDNPVAEQSARLYGTKSMACAWFRGIYAAHGEMELGLRHARLKEKACICRGAPCCQWESKW